MADVQPAEFTAQERVQASRAILSFLRLQPALSDNIWNIYVDPKTYKITVVVHDSVVDPVAGMLTGIPELETKSFSCLVEDSVGSESAMVSLPGLPLSRILTRFDVCSLLNGGLRDLFDGDVKAVYVQALSDEPKLLLVTSDETASRRVSEILKEASEMTVLTYNPNG